MTYLANKSIDSNNLGYFADEAALILAYPVGVEGVFALVGSTDTFWVWDMTTSAWVDSGGGSGSGDMILSASQTNSGAKTFLAGTLLLRNVANTFSSLFTNINTAIRTYTLPNKDGTVAMTSDITGINSGTNTGDQTSIVGISGTIAQFNTACTDADFATGGGTATNTNTGDNATNSQYSGLATSKVDANVAITGATKTKITYDAKGLVTAGADATTSDIADSSNKRYVTDAQLVVIGNTSGTNTGDNATNTQYSGLATSKVDANVAITGATKTKITYDAKGLVTAGADATTADIAASTDKNYVTDAQAVVIGNTSGTNTGDNATNSQYSGLAALIPSKTSAFVYVIDGGGVAITTGSKGFLSIPVGYTITGWTLVADQSGSAVVDVKKSTYAGFPTTSSICGADKPTLSSVQKNQNLSVTLWTTAVTAGDILEYNVDSATTVTRLTLTIVATKS